MMDSLTLKEKLLILGQKIYPRPIAKDILKTGDDIDNIIEFARRNRLAHFLALEYSQLFSHHQPWSDLCRTLIAEYNNYQDKVSNSLAKIKQILSGKQFMIVKTFSHFPHLTNDVDVLVKDQKGQSSAIHIVQEGLWPIHIEHKISWRGADAVSDDFAWQNTQKFVFRGEEFLVPNQQLDALIRLAHIPFETGQVKLGELLHIYRQISLSNWQVLSREAQIMAWPKTFNRMSAILELLHQRLFKQPLLPQTRAVLYSQSKIEFPFPVPFSLLAAGVIEKRAWKKIYGARFLIKQRLSSWVKKSIH